MERLWPKRTGYDHQSEQYRGDFEVPMLPNELVLRCTHAIKEKQVEWRCPNEVEVVFCSDVIGCKPQEENGNTQQSEDEQYGARDEKRFNLTQFEK